MKIYRRPEPANPDIRTTENERLPQFTVAQKTQQHCAAPFKEPFKDWAKIKHIKRVAQSDYE